MTIEVKFRGRRLVHKGFPHGMRSHCGTALRAVSPARPHRGFTLIEVLLVLAILGAIMSMVVPKLLGRQHHANVDATRISIRGVEQALKLYALDHSGEYPSTGDGLQPLVQSPNGRDFRWRGPYLDKPPTDAWGSTLEYIFPGRNNPGSFDVVSPGPDRVSGTGDDIGNWEAS